MVRGKQEKVRSKEKVKLLRDRFKHLQGGSTEVHNKEERREELNEEDDWDINLQDKPRESIEEDIRIEIPEGREVTPAAQLDHQPQIQTTAATPHSTRKSGTQRREPERFRTAATEEQTRQLSPRERRKRPGLV